MYFFQNSPKTNTGFSLVEVVVALAIFLLAIVGIYGIYSGSVKVMQAADQSAVCSANMLQRLDQIRRTSWANAIDPTFLSSTNVLGKAVSSTTNNVPGVVSEYVTVSAMALPYASPVPSATPTPSATPASFTVTRSGTSVYVSPSPASSMVSQQAVKIKVGITWNDQTNRQHNREFSTIISNAGLAR